MNKLGTKLQCRGGKADSIPFQAIVASPNARLGGCMSLTFTMQSAIPSDVHFKSMSLVLEQRCDMPSNQSEWNGQGRCANTEPLALSISLSLC
jgi:hypothetical protein